MRMTQIALMPSFAAVFATSRRASLPLLGYKICCAFKLRFTAHSWYLTNVFLTLDLPFPVERHLMPLSRNMILLHPPAHIQLLPPNLCAHGSSSVHSRRLRQWTPCWCDMLHARHTLLADRLCCGHGRSESLLLRGDERRGRWGRVSRRAGGR